MADEHRSKPLNLHSKCFFFFLPIPFPIDLSSYMVGQCRTSMVYALASAVHNMVAKREFRNIGKQLKSHSYLLLHSLINTINVYIIRSALMLIFWFLCCDYCLLGLCPIPQTLTFGRTRVTNYF